MAPKPTLSRPRAPRRAIFLPVEQRHISRAYALRLARSGSWQHESRQFRCECCGANRELCEAHARPAGSPHLKLEHSLRYVTTATSLCVCSACDREWTP